MAATETKVARFNARASEIQWRGVQRDAIALFALILCGSIAAAGVGALAAPVVLLFLASMWGQHDRRIGSNARYLRNILEPAMASEDQVEGFEEYLDKIERIRSHNQKWNFGAVTSRLYFPTLQSAMATLGVWRYAVSDNYPPLETTLVITASLVNLTIIALTWIKVKRERSK